MFHTPLSLKAESGNEYVNGDSTSRSFFVIRLKPELTAQKSGSDKFMVITLDNSGSMSGEKLKEAKKAAKNAVDILKKDDIVSVLVFSSTVNELVEPTNLSTKNKNKIKNNISKIDIGGGTALYKAISSSIERFTQKKGFLSSFFGRQEIDEANYLKRILLLTDGQPTEGPEEIDDFIRIAKKAESKNISILAMGLGGNHDEVLMGAVAKSSNGLYNYLPDSSKISEIFIEHIEEASNVVLKDVEITIEPMQDGKITVYGKDIKKTGNTIQFSCPDIEQNSILSIYGEAVLPPRKEGLYRIANVKASYRTPDGQTGTISDDLTINYTYDVDKVVNTVNKAINAQALAIRYNDDIQELLMSEGQADNTKIQSRVEKIEELATQVQDPELAGNLTKTVVQLKKGDMKSAQETIIQTNTGKRTKSMDKEA